MMKQLRCQSGFTMIELIITMVILAIVVGGVISYSANVYRQYKMTADLGSMRTDAANIRALMQAEADKGAGIKLNADNRGVTITTKNESNLFFLRDGAVYLRHNNTTERKLTQFNVQEAIWTLDKGILTMDLTFSYNNIQTKKTCYEKIIKDVYSRK